MDFLKRYGTSQAQIQDFQIGNALKKIDEEITSAPRNYFHSHKTSNLVKDYLTNRDAHRGADRGIQKLKNRIIEKRSEKGNIYTYIFKWILCSYYLYKVSNIESKFRKFHKVPELPDFLIYKTYKDFKFLLQNNGFRGHRKCEEMAKYFSEVVQKFQMGSEWNQDQIDQINGFIIAYLKEKQPAALLEINRLEYRVHGGLIKPEEVDSVLEWEPATAPIQASSDITAAIASTATKAAKVSLSVGFSLLKVAFWAITP